MSVSESYDGKTKVGRPPSSDVNSMAFLTAISGSGFGKRFELNKQETVLGRHPDCDVTIEVGAVSRQHAMIYGNGERFELEDLKSRNGTFLNGQLLSEKTPLSDGDLIRICDIEYSFHMGQPSSIDSALLSPPGGTRTNDGSSFGVVLIDDDGSSESSREFSSKLDIRGSQYGSQLTTSSEVRLQAMLEISRNMGGAVKLEEVLPKVLDTLFKIFLQADRAFIVLREGEELVPRWFKTRKEQEEDSIRISRTIMREVMETKQSIISLDASSDQRFQMSHSITDFKIRSIIVAPLLDSKGNPLGAMQMDTLDSQRRFEQGDLEILSSIATQAGFAIENAQLHEAAVQQQLVEQDLELARSVQAALLPKQPPNSEGYEYFSYYRAADQIGGDYYDYIELADGRQVIIVADVSGHGIAAAMLMAKLSAETKFLLATEACPAVAITRLNERIFDLNVEKFVTLLCLILEPHSGKLEIVNAGHMAPLWLKPDGSVQEPGYEKSGFPIGVLDGFEYEMTEVELERGDRLVLYTDGINEAPNKDSQFFGIARLQQLVGQASGELQAVGEQIVADVRKFIAGTKQEDDMCLVIVGRKP